MAFFKHNNIEFLNTLFNYTELSIYKTTKAFWFNDDKERVKALKEVINKMELELKTK